MGENQKGILDKYNITKADGSQMPIGGEYFVLRLDNNGSDIKHVQACREAVITYATRVQNYYLNYRKS